MITSLLNISANVKCWCSSSANLLSDIADMQTVVFTPASQNISDWYQSVLYSSVHHSCYKANVHGKYLIESNARVGQPVFKSYKQIYEYLSHHSKTIVHNISHLVDKMYML